LQIQTPRGISLGISRHLEFTRPSATGTLGQYFFLGVLLGPFGPWVEGASGSFWKGSIGFGFTGKKQKKVRKKEISTEEGNFVS